MSRSTFSILPYINRQKVKADGTANILCRITVDGKSAAISTGISCTPQEWNAKKGEVRNARDSGRLASFLAGVKDKYNSLLTTNGIITVEMLKAVLKDKDTTGRFLLNFGKELILPSLHAMLHINAVHGVAGAPDQLLNGIFLFFRVYHAVSACIIAIRPAEMCIYPQSITLAEKAPF